MITLLIKPDDRMKTKNDVKKVFPEVNILCVELFVNAFSVIVDTDMEIKDLVEKIDAEVLTASKL